MHPSADITLFYVQEIGAFLFGLVFLFLYRQSRAAYFGFWACAWALRIIATVVGLQLVHTEKWSWLSLYAVFEFAFALALVAAGHVGFASGTKDWRGILRLVAILPIFVALIYAFGSYSRLETYYASHAVVLGFVYLYNFAALRDHAGAGGRIFRYSLLALAAAFLGHAVVFLYLYNPSGATAWEVYLHQKIYYDLALHCVLAFAAMAMWSESQIDRLREMSAELDHLRRESRQRMDLDGLTGLLNQAALARRVESPETFDGAIAVCDMDNFKEINDRYGHLVGDEILRNIGHLLRGSIRQEDEAYRWGGDEFVLLFRNQRPDVARARLEEIEERLRDFRVRGHGTLPIAFSWGAADARGRALREALEEADHNMYALKRSRGGESAPRAHR
jgi:diguanylate cyclase (GGDEF)-like protein